MSFGLSRRAFLAVAAQVVKQPAKKARPLPPVGEFTRLVDPITENYVVRLTMLNSSNVLPFSRNHFVSARERLLLFSSDRSGHFAPCQIDLRTGVIRQLADTPKLNPRSLAFDRQEKSIQYLDGDALFEASLAHGSPKLLMHEVSSFTNAADGSTYLISSGKLIRKDGNDIRTLADSAIDAWPQPNGAGCLFSTSDGLFYAASSRPVLIAEGKVREPYWDVGGQSVIFLRDVVSPNGTVLSEIHGRALSGAPEYVVEPTSQFATFAPNSDATVFVGASRSRAQPNVIIMLRSPRREMTLCEHRASHPSEVSPVFSPDNRRVYFASDREGRPAIYSVNVELLVEPE